MDSNVDVKQCFHSSVLTSLLAECTDVIPSYYQVHL